MLSDRVAHTGIDYSKIAILFNLKNNRVVEDRTLICQKRTINASTWGQRIFVRTYTSRKIICKTILKKFKGITDRTRGGYHG